MAGEFEDDATLDEGAAPAPPQKGKSKILIMGVPDVVILAAVAYFVVMKFVFPEMPESVEEEIMEEIEEAQPFGLAVGFDDLTVNIQEGRRTRYVVFSTYFEVADEATSTELTGRTVQVKDVLLNTIRSYSIDQLNNGLFIEDTLKSIVKEKVDALLVSGEIETVFFPSYVVD